MELISRLLSSLVAHPASALVSVVVIALLIRLLAGIRRRGEAANGTKVARNSLSSYVRCFVSGVLLVNALAHFTHGISGEDFPGPFGYVLRSGLPGHLANVVWGFINLVLGVWQFFEGDVRGSIQRTGIFFFGVLLMGLFLSFVFSRGHA
jgi:hypothetical protein